MKNLLIALLLPSLFILMSASSVTAQEEEREPTRYENPQWKRVILVDYKPGQAGKAREIIRNNHAKASELAGTPRPEMILTLHSGEYDLMVIWAMQGGISDMDWEVSPNNIKWRKAMNEIAGSAEKASEIMKEYSNCINKSTSYIARQ